jgi:hypothetical protein
MALVRERTTLTERPPLVGEVSANFCGYTSFIVMQCHVAHHYIFSPLEPEPNMEE